MRVRPEASQLTWCPHPILAAAGREMLSVEHRDGESLQDYFRRAGVTYNGPCAAWLNGRQVPRAEWLRTTPEAGDVIVLRAIVEDGGDGGSDPVRTILTIAVIAAGVYFPPLLAGAGGLGLTGTAFTVGSALIGGVIQIGGTLAINALFPPPTPRLAQAQRRESAPSPTYSLAGGANRARPFEPLPVLIGTHRMFPDLGAKEFTEILGRQQYLYSAFNFGTTEMTLSDIRIGNNPVGNFAEVQTEESGMDGAIDLFPGNVDTTAGAALTTSFIQRTTSVDATAIGFDVEGQLFSTSNINGQLAAAAATIEAEYAVAASGVWLPFFSGGNQAVITHGGRSPVRQSFRRSVAKGQYDVRIRHVSTTTPNVPIPSNWTVFDDLAWTQLRTYQSDAADYDGQKRLAFRIRASGQLSGRLDQVSAIATGECEAWTGAAWVVQANSNPAWWFREVAKGRVRASDGRRLYGGGVPDARIDEDAIKDWGAWCTSKSLECNLVFDQSLTVGDMLSAIARCGRAAPTWATGKLGVVFDQQALPVVQLFGPFNIRAGTFNVEYTSGPLADEIVARFVNPDIDWQQDEVRVAVGGVSNPIRPAVLELFGVTIKAQAGKEANLLAARQIHHRRRITWESDFEGFVANRGDVVALTHDLTQWGYGGRLVAGTTTVLTLDREVTFTPAQTHWVQVRYPDGTKVIESVVFSATPTATLTLDNPLPAAPDADTENEVIDYVWQFDAKATPGKKAKLVDIQPVSETHVRLTAIDEVDAFYDAESAAFVHFPVTPATAFPSISNLQISEELTEAGGVFVVEFTLDWDVVGPYGGARVRIGINGGQLEDRGTVREHTFRFVGQAFGTLDIEVTAQNLAGKPGAQSVATISGYTIVGKDAAPNDVTNLTVTAGTDGFVDVTWTGVEDVDVVSGGGYEIRYLLGSTFDWDMATPLVTGHVTESPVRIEFTAADGVYSFGAKAVDTSGNESVNEATVLGVTTAHPSNVDAPIDIVLTSGDATAYRKTDGTVVSRLLVQWTDPTHASAETVTIQIRRFGGAWEPAGTVDIGVGQAYVWDVEDGVTYEVRLRAVAERGFVSTWSAIEAHIIKGSTAPPSDVQNFTVTAGADGFLTCTWDAAPDVDIKGGGGYQIRYQLGATFDWAPGINLHDGNLPGSPFRVEFNQGDETYSFGLRSINPSGILSDNAATALSVDTTHPSQVDTPTGLTLTSGDDTAYVKSDGTVVSRIQVEWTDPTHASAEAIGIQVLRPAGVWEPVGTAELGLGQAYVWDVEDGVAYSVRIRTRAFGYLSAWVTELNHVVVGKTLPPPDPASLLANTLPDGTREFRWSLPSLPKDLAGYLLRYQPGTGHAWGALTGQLSDEDTGMVLSSPYETAQLPAGTFTFGVAAVDTSGNISGTPKVIEATLGDPPIAGSLTQLDLVREGFSGQKVSCSVGSVFGELVGDTAAGQQWANMITWATHPNWIFDSVAAWEYRHEDGAGGALIDLGFDGIFTPLLSLTTTNANVTVTYNYKTDAGAYSGWVTVTGPITARYIRIRIEVAVPDTGKASVISQAFFIAAAQPIEEVVNDLDTSTLGAPVGDFRLPINETYAVITAVQVIFQNTGGGWSYEIIDKDPSLGPRIKTYNATPALADATIDAVVRGL